MKFSCNIPIGHIGPEFQSLEAVTEMAQALERAGIDACNVTDHPAPDADWLHARGHDALDPFTALAFVGAKTTSLLLHTYIVVLPYRNPFITAKAAATLQVLSDGRLIMGVGGGYQKSEFEALGVDFHKRGAIMDDALDTIRLAWAGGRVVKQGMGYNAIGNEPRPAPETAPKIWIGGGSDKAMERAARVGDGWNPFFVKETMSKLNKDTGIVSSEDLAEKIGKVKAYREKHGQIGPFDFASDPPIDWAAQNASTAAQYIDQLMGLAEVGLNWAVLDPLVLGGSASRHPTRQMYLDSVQWFGEEVIAKIRK